MNISFLTSGHYPYDDRIFFHLGKSLSEAGHKVEIVSSKSGTKEVTQGISINCFEGDNLSKREKIKRFIEYLSNFNPEIIICSEPLPLLPAKQFKLKRNRNVKILYDITEWHPSAENLSAIKGPKKFYIFLKLLLFNLFSSSFTDGFIFGEWHKSKPYRLFFPFKPFVFITYYPDLNYISQIEPAMLPDKLCLVYSGKISIDKGFRNFMNVVSGLPLKYKDLQIYVKIIGWYESEHDKTECQQILENASKNISCSFTGRLSFNDFIGQLKDTDIFLDLRTDNFENRYSLLIKIFYYAALGRPVIYFDSVAIRANVEIAKFGFLVKPDDSGQIIKIISDYLENNNLYAEHCRNARKLAEEKYNWQKISPEFLRFIESLIIR